MAPHTCPDCSRSFTRLENLKRHQKIHGGRLPHRCLTCHKEFSRSDLAKKHSLLHLRPDNPAGTQRNSASARATRLSSRSIGNRGHTEVVATPEQHHGSASDSGFDQCLDSTIDSSPEGGTRDFTTRGLNNAQPYFQQDPTAGTQSQLMGANATTDTQADFSAFTQPWADYEAGVDEIFTLDFYDELRETFDTLDPAFILDSDNDNAPRPNGTQSQASYPDITGNVPTDGGNQHVSHANYEVPISRIPSPPNVPSQEDSVAFAWNPSSARIAQSHPICVDSQHPLIVNHNPRFDMDEATWFRVKEFLEPQNADFILPSLTMANVFVGLFFEHFYPQTPVFHLPTLDINSLPPASLAVLVVIGAKHSHLRHTRRFSILVLERAQRKLEEAIRQCYNHVRDPQVIYAYALMCYVGLWCGNKRAFEVAEASRGALVTYIRRLPKQANATTAKQDSSSQWAKWISAESRRRLIWFVFMIDMQFPTTLNMKSMISLSETAEWECPCDSEFWSAPTERSWRNLLGSASLPPAPKFSIVLDTVLSHEKSTHEFQGASQPIPRLNQWTSFLALLSIASKALEWSHDQTLATSMVLDVVGENDFPQACSVGRRSPQIHRLVKMRANILASLNTFNRLNGSLDTSRFPVRSNTDAYFQNSSSVVQGLVHMLLHVPVTDLQNVLGKAGAGNIVEAMHNLSLWSEAGICMSNTHDAGSATNQGSEHPSSDISTAFYRAIADLVSMAEDPSLQSAVPFSLISVFLNYVLLWSVAKVASVSLQEQLAKGLDGHIVSATPSAIGLKQVLVAALSGNQRQNEGIEKIDAIFRHAAEPLIHMGTWGASLNLALLLHRRSGT